MSNTQQTINYLHVTYRMPPSDPLDEFAYEVIRQRLLKESEENIRETLNSMVAEKMSVFEIGDFVPEPDEVITRADEISMRLTNLAPCNIKFVEKQMVEVDA